MTKRCVECRNIMMDGQEICPTCGFDQNYAYMIPQKKKRIFPVILAVICLLIIGATSVYFLMENGVIEVNDKKITRLYDYLTTTSTTTLDTSYMITAEQDYLEHIEKYIKKTEEQFTADSASKYNFDGYFVYKLNDEIKIDDEYKINGYILINANNRDIISYTLFTYNKYFEIFNYQYLSTQTDNEYSNIPTSVLEKYTTKNKKNYESKEYICNNFTDTYYPCYTK